MNKATLWPEPSTIDMAWSEQKFLQMQENSAGFPQTLWEKLSESNRRRIHAADVSCAKSYQNRVRPVIAVSDMIAATERVVG